MMETKNLGQITFSLLDLVETVITQLGGSFSGNEGDEYFTGGLIIKPKDKDHWKLNAYGKVFDMRLLNATGAFELTSSNPNIPSNPAYIINGVHKLEITNTTTNQHYIIERNTEEQTYYVYKEKSIIMSYNKEGKILYQENNDLPKITNLIQELYANLKG